MDGKPYVTMAHKGVVKQPSERSIVVTGLTCQILEWVYGLYAAIGLPVVQVF